MKKLILLITISVLLTCSVFAQKAAETPIEVLILGTFHFAQNQSDDDMLSAKRQREIAELLDKIAAFKPDKIFIEQNPEFEYVNKISEKYRDYVNGQDKLPANEIYQLGFRLGKRLGHPALYQADHPGMYSRFYREVEQYAERHGQTDILEADAAGTSRPLFMINNRDERLKESTVLEYFRYLNSPEYQRLDQGWYASTFPRIGDTAPPKSDAEADGKDETYFLGAELLADWYKRNIKIYANVLTQLDYKEKRILIIYGNGHSSILRHLFESNPSFKVANTLEWLK